MSQIAEEMRKTMARLMLKTLRGNAPILRILLSARSSMTMKMRERYWQELVLCWHQLLEGYFEKQVQEGVFRRDSDPAILAQLFVGLFFPTILLREILQIVPEEPINDVEAVSSCVRTFLYGL